MLASVPEQDSTLLDPLRALGCETTHNNLDTVHNSDVILLGVKPFVVPLVLAIPALLDQVSSKDHS